MANRISAEVRKLILDDLVLIGSVTGGQYVVEFTKRVFPADHAGTRTVF